MFFFFIRFKFITEISRLFLEKNFNLISKTANSTPSSWACGWSKWLSPHWMLYDEWAIPKWTNERADVRKSIRCEIKCVAFDPTPDGHQTSSMCSVSVNQKNIRMPITVSSDKKKCKQREIRIISKSTMCVESCNFIIFVSLFESRHTIKRIVRFFLLLYQFKLPFKW